ncbi:hypothetical protein [Kitasatospora sp. MAP5-34]|uniref:hypothetical protein n=1 Tax=Kitasatospora sp. MAP5-34 TaxID=3035102 RepID=UPI0024753AD3|nr:hypothetical protein [Kitasatospora sp. MAP5-34]MDH6577756.1 NAD(P)-dependent dehydrogenase (short-subunit alcohol dehydrogenase family) [Kitasatospora sp. MAP5-34]
MNAPGDESTRDPFRVDGTRALVTGASRGIGQAIAVAFARTAARPADLALALSVSSGFGGQNAVLAFRSAR